MGLFDAFQHAYDIFKSRASNRPYLNPNGYNYSYKPDRVHFSVTNERSFIASIYNKIAVDVANIDIREVKIDENGRYLETVESDLTKCLTLSPNTDQTAFSFKLDCVMSMFDEGCIAIVPVDTDLDPFKGAYKINELRVGKIEEWFPEDIRVRLYNEKTGAKEELILPKRLCAIVENPFYTVMNEPNSTIKRLVRKLDILDAIDEQSGSGKLDMIIQLPYVVRSDLQKKRAEERKKDIEVQLSGSKYGIAYIDGTEKVTQLNRPVENNLMNQIEYLTKTMYSQLGTSEEVFEGTADEPTMLNYYNRTIDTILTAITEAMKKSFLTKTSRTQGHSIMYFRDPFKLCPVEKIAEIADRMTRNEILSSNEIRAIIGFKPSSDPSADELRNKNLNKEPGGMKQMQYPSISELISSEKNQNDSR